jgi:hypothetical protein
MRAKLTVVACALFAMSATTACSSLSKPDEIRVVKDVPAPTPVVAAPERGAQPIQLPRDGAKVLQAAGGARKKGG